MHEITFNGVNSSTLGIRIERSPAIIHPRRKFDVISVPGRNGDIVLFQDAWENYIQPYDIFFGDGTDLSAESAANAVSNWLHSANGYAMLVDTFEWPYYRMAYYVDELDIENALTEYGRATIRFNCKPERFYQDISSGIISGQTVTNNFQFASRPIITFNAAGQWSGTLSVTNGMHEYEVEFTNVYGALTLNCEEQNAYHGNTNLNSKVKVLIGDEFPKLYPGANVISWTMSSVSSATLNPRWFII